MEKRRRRSQELEHSFWGDRRGYLSPFWEGLVGRRDSGSHATDLCLPGGILLGREGEGRNPFAAPPPSIKEPFRPTSVNPGPPRPSRKGSPAFSTWHTEHVQWGRKDPVCVWGVVIVRNQ